MRIARSICQQPGSSVFNALQFSDMDGWQTICCVRRQCSPVVRALALRSGDPGFKTRSDHSLNLFLVVPGSTSQLHLYI